ncbi:hypothetical protein D3C77_556170 [compost metagenome]
MADIISAVNPLMDSVMALTKAVMEMSVAGRSSSDEKFRDASERAFVQVGDAIEGLKRTRFELDLLASQPPEGERSDAADE